MNFEVDEYFYLSGDEDCDVGLMCRKCDRGGAPIVFYTTNKNVTGYWTVEVIMAYSISELFAAGAKHLVWHRSQAS